MDEYITKKQVIEWLRCYAHEDRPIRFEDLEEDLEFDIQHMIPEDVAPVRHGRWVKDGEVVFCSECGEEHAWDEYRATYCEDCGTRMDLEV